MITYRKAELTDNDVVTKLLCELYDIHSYEKLLSENNEHFTDDKQAFFLAFVGNVAVGICHGALRSEYVNGKEYNETAGYLEAIYIRPEYRLRGIAKSLVAICEEWVKKNGCRELLSDCLLNNTDSYKLHIKLGFIETERCIFFRKELLKE